MSTEKLAPVQGYAAGIPWSMHLRAYDAYCKKYNPQPAMIDLEGRNCRGGFHVEELDMFIPGWREELSELTHLRAESLRLVSANDALESVVATLQETCAHYEERLKVSEPVVATLQAERDGLREALEKELDDSFNLAECGLATEKLSGNVVKAEYWKGELATIHRLRIILSTPPTAALPDGEELLDWLEAQVKASPSGISFDWCRYAEDGFVVENGFRFMRHHFLGERKKSLRAAIRAAIK